MLGINALIMFEECFLFVEVESILLIFRLLTLVKKFIDSFLIRMTSISRFLIGDAVFFLLKIASL